MDDLQDERAGAFWFGCVTLGAPLCVVDCDVPYTYKVHARVNKGETGTHAHADLIIECVETGRLWAYGFAVPTGAHNFSRWPLEHEVYQVAPVQVTVTQYKRVHRA